VAFGEIA